ncbi:MAG: hypothetical protein ACRDQ6_18170 [Pseudonocardiaceae bacterium]
MSLTSNVVALVVCLTFLAVDGRRLRARESALVVKRRRLDEAVEAQREDNGACWEMTRPDGFTAVVDIREPADFEDYAEPSWRGLRWDLEGAEVTVTAPRLWRHRTWRFRPSVDGGEGAHGVLEPRPELAVESRQADGRDQTAPHISLATPSTSSTIH